MKPLRRDQIEVIQCLAEGLTCREIGIRLGGLSEQAVKDRISVIRRQVGARNAAHLVAIAAGRGQLWL